MTPPTWSDVEYDLEAARVLAVKAADKDAALAGLPADAREDRELAIGKHLHDAVSAIERALERLVQDIDGDLLDRAARPMPGRRPAILSAETRRELGLLVGVRHAFRHSYGGFDTALARPNVAVAAAAVPRAVAEIGALAIAIGIRPEG